MSKSIIRPLLVAVIMAASLVVAMPALSNAGAICNNSSVSNGDLKLKVVQVCGQPIACQQTPIYNGQYVVGTREECLFYTDFNQRTFYFFNNELQDVR